MTLPTDREVVERTLGTAVHPAAIDRLFELVPRAYVEVDHTDGRHDGVELKITTVRIREVEGGATLRTRAARCRLDADTWDRRRGIRLAFNRALKALPRPADG